MANNNTQIKFDYTNINNCKSQLENSKSVMNDEFIKLKNELNSLEDNWSGSASEASALDMSNLIREYDKFLEKVTDFINALSTSNNTFVETESTAKNAYNK